MKRTVRGIVGILVAVMLSALLSACGGGGGGGGSTSLAKTAANGIFANVSGLGFSSGSKTGITGASGVFTYVAGDTAIFKVGDIEIGTVKAGTLLTPLHFFPYGTDASDHKVVNIMRFLMSIGTYDDVNLTIAIRPDVLIAAKDKTFDFTTVIEPATGQPLLDLVKQLNNSATLVDAATATAFLSKIIYKYYGGVYTGTFSGPASSNYWEMTINTTPNILDGKVVGKGLDGDKEELSGNMTNGINFNGVATGNCLLSGKLNIFTGEFSGDWSYTDPSNIRPSQAGTFKGIR